MTTVAASRAPSIEERVGREALGKVMAVRKTAKQLDDVDVIDTTVQKTYRWIDEISEELGGIGRREAYRDLRAFLQTVRDRLTVDLAAELGAQLPMLVRGIYYEAWDPSRVPVKMKAEEFVEVFIDRAVLPPEREPLAALKAAARVLRRHVSEGETENVLLSLPLEIRALLG
jgi:uncharacterized protein (DUF2267 family)